jgi:hypothetical protein
MKHVSEMVHELRREQVQANGGRADESEGDRETSFECHRRAA